MGDGKTVAEAILKGSASEKIDSMLRSEGEAANDNAQVANSAIENSVINNGSIVINAATESDKVERKASHNKRSTDKFISVAQAAQLKDMVVKIEEMETQRTNGKQAKAIWTGLSDHCNVPHSKSATPRYQLICESQFHQAMNYLLTWKNNLLKELNQSLKSQTESLKKQSEAMKQHTDSLALRLTEIKKSQVTPTVEEKHWLEKLASLIVGK